MYVARLVVATLVLFMGVLGYVYYENTLIVWWIPVVLSAVVALLTVPLLGRRWRWLTGSDSRFLNLLCHCYVVGLLFYFAILGGNYLLADASTACEREALVLSKKSETKERRFRVRRHTYQNKTVHYYYLNVCFEDGTCKLVPVSLSVYNRSRVDGKRTFSVQRGGWGIWLIK